jgi:hypothetical protein
MEQTPRLAQMEEIHRVLEARRGAAAVAMSELGLCYQTMYGGPHRGYGGDPAPRSREFETAGGAQGLASEEAGRNRYLL